MHIFVAVETFKDRVLGVDIHEGALYPPLGAKVPDDWPLQLESGENACGRPFLRRMDVAEVGYEDEADAPAEDAKVDPPASKKTKAVKEG